jgi:hypothetical protein
MCPGVPLLTYHLLLEKEFYSLEFEQEDCWLVLINASRRRVLTSKASRSFIREKLRCVLGYRGFSCSLLSNSPYARLFS